MTKINIACLWTLLFCLSAFGQKKISVTSYGAVGDAAQFWVTTSSNSTAITASTNLPSSYIGESIEIAGTGTQTTGSNNQDQVTSITAISGTNITIAVPALQTLTNTFATAGTNNTPMFMAAVGACARGDSNDWIHVPAGNYLLLTTNRFRGYGFEALLLTRGGLNFYGDGTNSTRLISQFAWFSNNAAVWRGDLVELASPMKNHWPISFSSMSLDGGLTNGNTPWHFFPANTVYGAGWDVTHSAIVEWIANGGSWPDLYLTNDLIEHWRGEELKSIDQPTNGLVRIINCRFTDGNATALNIYPAWDVVSNQFDNLDQVAEYYQQYDPAPSVFLANFITNISRNGFSFNGATGTNQPFVMAFNTFYIGGSGVNGLEFQPGCNITVASNYFEAQGNGVTMFSIGTIGYQGTFCNSNIVIVSNTIIGADLLSSIGNSAPNNAANIVVASNSVALRPFGKVVESYGLATNVHFYANNFGSSLYVVCISGRTADGTRVGQFALVDTNNLFSPAFYATPSTSVVNNSTNVISYWAGPFYVSPYDQPANVTFVLEDSSSNQIPPGAMIVFENVQTNFAYRVFYSQTMRTGFETMQPASTNVFYWNANAMAWQSSQ
jgi:hypothetical protein